MRAVNANDRINMLKKILCLCGLYLCLIAQSIAQEALEPLTYSEDFEDRELGAWASYPLWQDTAYDPNFRVNEIVPQDPNISVVQKVTPYSNVDNYAGAQKLLDIYLGPQSKVSFRYYLKTNKYAEFIKVRFAAGELGRIDVTMPSPVSNAWVDLTVDFEDLIRENPDLKDKKKIRAYALAIFVKIPNADPDMPFYLGLDDITVDAQQKTAFKFTLPEVFKLPEFSQYIPKNHYSRGDQFNLSGQWKLEAEAVTLEILSFTDRDNLIYNGALSKNGDTWALNPLKLSFPNGLYVGRLTASKNSVSLSSTEFTIHITPKAEDMAGKHPRLLFDEDKKEWIDKRFTEERFKTVYDDILENAEQQRSEFPLDTLIFDLDQFPNEVWLPTWPSWVSHIFSTAGALRSNAMAYSFHGDREAGLYVKDMLLKFSEWPHWSHPWQQKRGRYSEHNTGSWSHRLAEAYDLTYDLMSSQESLKIRQALMKNIVKGGYQTYVYNDNITSKTSNWIAMITGGSLMTMAAIYGDGSDTENLEPYFTGTMLKYYAFLNRVTDSKDGSWGEGLGYNSYSFSNLAYSVPSINNVFNIDVSASLVGTYNEYIWSGLLKERKWFDFGDSTGDILPVSNWAFLLEMQQEPRLGWYYNYLKNNKSDPKSGDYFKFLNEAEVDNSNETFQDVLYDTTGVEQDPPFDESPIKAFHHVGTTVFKSGWEKDDFVFVMRTGPFFNHQHLDQGSFYVADKGKVFIEDRHLNTSDYYDDPLYQSSLTQPVAHSTILINGNHQSQRVGDPSGFAPGFDDHAFIAHFLDGRDASFSSGDIGRLYWDKVKSLTRNVLYLKPRAVLMVDIAVPEKEDIDVSLLYQTMELADIKVGQEVSTITKGGTPLNIAHIAPGAMDIKAVETPHYLKTLRNVKPLKKEGMIKVTSRTENGQPLVMANIIGSDLDVITMTHDDHVSGTVSGKNFAFTTNPNNIYNVEQMQTDAVALSWTDDVAFVASATIFSRNRIPILKSDVPITFEVSPEGLKYYHNQGGNLIIGAEGKPSSVLLNGRSTENIQYDAEKKEVTVNVPKGEGIIVIN